LLFGVLKTTPVYLFFFSLFSFQFSFFFSTALGFFLLFLSAFIFTCHIMPIRFSAFENERSARFDQRRLVERPFYPIWNICSGRKLTLTSSTGDSFSAVYSGG